MTGTPRPATVVTSLDSPRGPLVVTRQEGHPEPFALLLAGEELSRCDRLSRALLDASHQLGLMEPATNTVNTSAGPVHLHYLPDAPEGRQHVVEGFGGRSELGTADEAMDEVWRRRTAAGQLTRERERAEGETGEVVRTFPGVEIRHQEGAALPYRVVGIFRDASQHETLDAAVDEVMRRKQWAAVSTRKILETLAA